MTGKKIYIVDDDPITRELVELLMQHEGYETETFADGESVLQKLRTDTADLIILDIVMPGKNGFHVCKEIRKTSTVPIIMLSNRNSDLDYATGLSIGSDDYFTKPVNSLELSMRVKSIFRRIDYCNADKGLVKST